MDDEKLLDKLSSHQMSACLIDRGEERVFTYYRSNQSNVLQVLNSVSKSVLALAIGLSVEDGLISLETRSGQILTTIHPGIENKTIYDLLTMRSGYSEKQWQKAIVKSKWQEDLAQISPDFPGMKYSNADSYLLSSILSEIHEGDWSEYLRKRLFNPMGIKKFKWDASPEGILIGGYGLQLKAEDLLKIGKLVINQGEYKGNQIFNSDFISKMISPAVKHSTRNQHYGLHWWITPDSPVRYYAAGTNGKLLFVVPEKNLTAVFIGNLPNKDLMPFQWFTKWMMDK